MTGEQVLNVLKRIIELLIAIPGRINDFMSKTFNLAIDLTLFKIGDFEVKLGTSWIWDLLGQKAPVFNLWSVLGVSFGVVVTLSILKKVVPVI